MGNMVANKDLNSPLMRDSQDSRSTLGSEMGTEQEQELPNIQDDLALKKTTNKTAKNAASDRYCLLPPKLEVTSNISGKEKKNTSDEYKLMVPNDAEEGFNTGSKFRRRRKTVLLNRIKSKLLKFPRTMSAPTLKVRISDSRGHILYQQGDTPVKGYKPPILNGASSSPEPVEDDELG